MVLEWSQVKKFTLLHRAVLGFYLPDINKIELIWDWAHIQILPSNIHMTYQLSFLTKKKWHPYFKCQANMVLS